MRFNQSIHDEARALFDVSLSLDLVYEEYGMLYTVTVAHDYHKTGRATAQAVGLSESQTLHYLRIAKRTLPPGRPFDVFCKNGHDMSVHRKKSSGVTYCGECKRIRQKEADRLRYLKKKEKGLT